MSANRIQFQPGMSVPQFMELYGTEEKCEAALEQTRWPEGLSVFDAERESMAWFIDDATSDINVDSAAIKPPSPPEH